MSPSARIAIVTGGSRGLGRSTVLSLAKRGVHSIGPMIASLLSEDDRWINGQRIEVSGGMAL